jgi:HPt (histidine-containing phosphotransfer) domain-containing protein
VRGVAHVSAERGAAEHREPVPIDHHVLARLLCNDRDAEKEVLRAFLSAWPNDLEGLCRALDGPGRAAAMRLAHRMKGACRIVGANPLAEACERAERVLGDGNAALVDGAMSELSRETARAASYLREWLSRGG